MSEPLAIFSDDVLGPDGRGEYRYTLWRRGLQDIGSSQFTFEKVSMDDPAPRTSSRRAETMQFICLNPSTADERVDDPTVLRCWKRAQRMGYGAFCMTNLFALRSTDPAGLRRHVRPIGEGAENERHILRVGEMASIIVLAWGAEFFPLVAQQAKWVLDRLKSAGLWHKCRVLGWTKTGSPRHPLYMRNDLELMEV